MSANKTSTNFVCENCGAVFASWYGKCPECQAWGSLKEFKELKTVPTNKGSNVPTEAVKFVSLASVNRLRSERISSGLVEVDRVLGGGLIADQVILLSGEPGVGKSTLIMEMVNKIQNSPARNASHSDAGGNDKIQIKFKNPNSKPKIIYVSSEEEAGQISQRAKSLKINVDNILFSSQKNIEAVLQGFESLKEKQPLSLVVFDSLQGFYSNNSPSPAGSISQSKEVLMQIVNWAKTNSTVALVVGHITKEGEIAGPKFLEHMVDTVLFLEGERMTSLRVLRALKNRFGSVDETGFFEMTDRGMKEVANPSRYFLDSSENLAGKAVIGLRQGKRVLFATVEVLTVPTNLTFARRVVKGLDQKRVELHLAIIKKYLHLNTDNFDVFVNVAGGLRVDDPLTDLGVVAALYSSLTQKAFSSNTLFLGEVGLLGNIRTSSYTERIIKEAKRLGFSKVYSANNLKNIIALKNL